MVYAMDPNNSVIKKLWCIPERGFWKKKKFKKKNPQMTKKHAKLPSMQRAKKVPFLELQQFDKDLCYSLLDMVY